MYEAVVTHKGQASKSVRVAAPEDAKTDDVLSAAMKVAGETKARLFGWTMEFWASSGDWTVTLFTD